MKKNNQVFRRYMFCFLVLSNCLTTTLYAQERCGTVEYTNFLIGKDPSLKNKMENNERLVQQAIVNLKNHKTSSVIYDIPVVFHVLYTNATNNISDAQIFSQMDILNQDFRKLNSDIVNVPTTWQSNTADLELEFCLASYDPSGNPTTGIIRKQTTISQFSISSNDAKFNSTGGDDIWDRDFYLNIWVVPAFTAANILAYAQLPGTSANTDGIVVIQSAVGSTGTAQAPFNLGRTLVHETGHWFNLFHIWGDDDNSADQCSGTDQCNDTPNQQTENYGCPVFPHTDNCTTSSPGVMFMNYMDYVDDACMIMFTNDQKLRVQATIQTLRSSLQSSGKCCTNSLTLNGQNSNGSFLPYKASNDINSTVENLGGTNAEYKAGNLVMLEPGFKALSGSTFRAYNGTCNPYRYASGNTNPDESSIHKADNLFAFPNPFARTTSISYSLQSDQKVDIKIYNTQMQLVSHLLKQSQQLAGEHQIDFEAGDLPPGIYLCKLETDEKVSTVKIVLSK